MTDSKMRKLLAFDRHERGAFARRKHAIRSLRVALEFFGKGSTLDTELMVLANE